MMDFHTEEMNKQVKSYADSDNCATFKCDFQLKFKSKKLFSTKSEQDDKNYWKIILYFSGIPNQ